MGNANVLSRRCCLASAIIIRWWGENSNQEIHLRSDFVMTFRQRVRELRHAKEWSLRDLAAKVDVGFTCLS